MALADAGSLRAEVAAARARERAQLLSPAGQRHALRLGGMAVLVGGLMLTVLASLAFGARPVSLLTVVEALLRFDPANDDQLVVHDLRLPRTLVGLVVGAALAVAGALMQALTRNPLADPGLLGVNSGAAFAVVMAIWVFGIAAPGVLLWISLAGAGAVATFVYALGFVGGGGATPVRLALAGATVHALLIGLIGGVLMLSQETLDTYRFWIVGSLGGADGTVMVQLLPFTLIGLALAAMAAQALNALALGDEAAQALGTRLWLARATTLLAITLLCGAAVATAGPVGFVGLVVPHLARAWCGADQRWTLVYSALLGPILLLLCDVAGRVIFPPGEVQVGIMTALLGGPLFVAIVRRIRLSPL